MDLALLICFYLVFPILLIYLCYRFPLVNKIGAVIICYLAGMLLGQLINISPAIGELQNTLTSAAVALALPLLLFSMNVKAWFRLAGNSTLCMLLATIAIVAVAMGGYLLIRARHRRPGSWEGWPWDYIPGAPPIWRRLEPRCTSIQIFISRCALMTP